MSRPRYFDVHFDDGDVYQYTTTEVKKHLHPADTRLPAGVTLPNDAAFAPAGAHQPYKVTVPAPRLALELPRPGPAAALPHRNSVCISSKAEKGPKWALLTSAVCCALPVCSCELQDV